MKLRHILSTLGLMFLVSCASFRGNQLRQADEFPKINTERKPLLVELSQNRNSMNAIVVETKYGKKEVRDLFKKVIDDSGYFAEVVVRDSDVMREFKHDYELKISLNYEDSGDFFWNYLWATFSGATLTVIPYWKKVNYVMKAQLKNSAGKELGYFEIKEDMTYAVQLFLMFVSPFKWPSSVDEKITTDLAKNLMIQVSSKLR